MPERATTIQIPRWVQLVGLPLLLLLVSTVAGAVRQVVFLFLMAALAAFVAIRTLAALFVSHTRTAAERVDGYFTDVAGQRGHAGAGVLVVLPLLAASRAVWEFFAERVAFEPWREESPVPAAVRIEAVQLATETEPVPVAPVAVRPQEPPAAARR